MVVVSELTSAVRGSPALEEPHTISPRRLLWCSTVTVIVAQIDGYVVREERLWCHICVTVVSQSSRTRVTGACPWRR
jgi:hypothetical protein